MVYRVTPVKYRYIRQGFFNGVPDAGSEVAEKAFGGGQESIVGASNKSWKLQIAKRTDASTAYYRDGWTYEIPQNYLASQDKLSPPSWKASCRMTYMDAPVLGEMTDPAVRDIALARVKARLSSIVGDMQAVVPVVELRELRSTIVATADSALGMMHALADIKRTKGRAALRFASDAWLNWSLGVQPLISDTRKSILSIQDFLNRQDYNGVVSATAKTDWKSTRVGAQSGPYGFALRQKHDMYNLISYKFTAGYLHHILASNDYSIADHLHLEVKALPSVLWELTPYSWVADYFGTVGAYLEDTFTSNPTTCIYVTENKRFTCEAWVDYEPYATNTEGKLTSALVDRGRWSYYQFRRTPLAALPNRILRFKTPEEIAGKNTISKLLNLSALLVGRRA